MTPTWRAYADKLACRAVSILAQLPDSEFEEGMRMLGEHAVNAPPNEPVVEPIDFFWFRCA